MLMPNNGVNMGKWVYIKDIGGFEGKDVLLKGWLYNKRSSGKIHFLQLRDGTGIIQCVLSKGDVSEGIFELADKVTQECSIEIAGKVVEDKRSPIGFEIHAKDLKLVGDSPDYPISPKEHGTGFLMDKRHLWLRSKKQAAVLKIRDTLIRAIRDYFHKNGFVNVDAPIFTPNACEGTTTLFETEYFGQKAYLTQSGQLYMEAACMALGKVYCFGPTFRAEKSKTRRHLTEFWMIEPEVAYYDLEDNIRLIEDFVASIVERVLNENRKDLETIERDIKPLEKIKKPFERMKYEEAVKILQKEGSGIKIGSDFGGEDETILTKKFDKPLFVTHFPTEIKAFYMKRDPNDENFTLSVDLLAPEGYGEVVGGGQREDSLEELEKRIKEHKLPREAFEWYLDLRKYGTVPHSGFGLGLERTITWICGIHHLRETIPFPRLIDRLYP